MYINKVIVKLSFFLCYHNINFTLKLICAEAYKIDRNKLHPKTSEVLRDVFHWVMTRVLICVSKMNFQIYEIKF